ncbi:MAG TPA: asparagine synthetase B [bacterium]|nr:asparagine synthetase B [bacterium]
MRTGRRPGTFDRAKVLLLIFAAAATYPAATVATYLLIPMDDAQADHLRAYGICYEALLRGARAEWLLNYRGGSFLVADFEGLPELCLERGVTAEYVADPGPIYAVIEAGNMEAVPLTKAPRVALYAPANEEMWDDAVMLALDYAQIPYDVIWNDVVLSGGLYQYDWLHLHHEDFTGQFGKFYGSFAGTPWYDAMEAQYRTEAAAAGYPSVSAYMGAAAEAVERYVAGGGFLFAMCAAADTLDIALAARDVDVVAEVFDDTPVDPRANELLAYGRTLAFTDFAVLPNPYVYEYSDIDTPRSISPAADPMNPGSFTLFEFSAKADTVPTILTQNHRSRITEFMGQTTAFTRATVKKSVVILATMDGYEEAKYVYGNHGEGFFSFLGGHDPEDFQHFIGELPTDLRFHKNSPGYRLILNNILFPAVRREELKT